MLRLPVVTLLIVLCGGVPLGAQVTVDFSVDVSSGTNPLTVTFTDTSTGASPTGWLWQFGDGSQVLAGSSTSHTYTVGGPYTVSLTLFAGILPLGSTTQVDLISVDPAPLVPTISASHLFGVGALEVTFTAGSEGVTPTSWSWDLGDGTSATGPQPSHRYVVGEPQRFDVSLTVGYFGQEETVEVPGLITMAPARIAGPLSVGLPTFGQYELGDVDGDGAPDVVRDFGAEWWRNRGDASGFVMGQQQLLGVGKGGGDPALGDLDGDGDLDLAIVSGSGEGVGLWTLVNTDGAGTFGAPGLVDDASADEVQAADLDGDGDVDLLVADYPDSLRWYANDGSGGLGAPETIPLPGLLFSGSTVVADLDGDGDPDVTVSIQGQLFGLINDGTGLGWSAAALMAEPGGAIEVVDLDGDGDADLLTAWQGVGLSWAANDGTGGFPVLDALVVQAGAITGAGSGDMDGDGDRDILAGVDAAGSTDELVQLDQLTPGVFDAPRTLGLQPGNDLHVADLDQDGDLDVLVQGQLFRNSLVDPTWTGLGGGLAGATGEPELLSFGALAEASVVSLAVQGGLSQAPTVLVLGADELSAPFKGGVLVPFPTVLLHVATDAGGRVVLLAEWPAGVPAGLPLHAQAWIVDGAAVAGWAATAATVGVTGD